MEYAGQVLGIQNQMQAALSHREEREQILLRIGAGSISVKHLAAVYPQLLLKYPNLQLETKEGSIHRLLPFLKEKEIDIAIGSVNDTNCPGLKIAIFYRNELVLAVPAYHPVALMYEERGENVETLPLADRQLFQKLQMTPFLRYNETSSIGRVTRELCDKYNFFPIYECTFKESSFIDSLAETGQYVFLTFHSRVAQQKNMVHFRLPEPYYIYTAAVFRDNYELRPVDILLCRLLSQTPPPQVYGDPCPNMLTRSIRGMQL